MASELRETMRELRAQVPENIEVKRWPPHVTVRLEWRGDGTSACGEGTATCHPRDAFNLDRGVTIAYGRAVKDAARKLLERTWPHPHPQALSPVAAALAREMLESACRPERAPNERGGDPMAVWYKCWQCAEYEPSRRLAGWGICHDGCASLQPGQTVACARFRLHEEEPPEESYVVEADDEHVWRMPAGPSHVGIPLEDAELRRRVEALEEKFADLDVPQLASLVHNMHLDALPAIYRRMGTLEEGAAEAERLRKNMNSDIWEALRELRSRIKALEAKVADLDVRPLASFVQNMNLDALPAAYRRLGALEQWQRTVTNRLEGLEQRIERREDLLADLACRLNNIDGGGA